jgi:hypothetical protein
MSNLSGVVLQLKKQRDEAQKQVQRLDAALAALGNLSNTGSKRRTMSAAARRKIAAAQRARWAKVKRAA